MKHFIKYFTPSPPPIKEDALDYYCNSLLNIGTKPGIQNKVFRTKLGKFQAHFFNILFFLSSKSIISSYTLLYIRCYTFDCFFRILVSIKMEFTQILVELQQTFSTCFQLYCEDWRLVPGSFIILIKRQYNAIQLIMLMLIQLIILTIFDCLSAHLQSGKKRYTRQIWFLINCGTLLN